MENGSATLPSVWLSCRTLAASREFIGFVGLLGASTRSKGVRRDVAQPARPDECGLEQHVGVRDGVAAVAVLHHVALELLDLPCGDLPHGGLAELGAQEVLRVPAVAVRRGGEDVAGGLLHVYVVEDVAVDRRLTGDGAGELLVLSDLLVAPLPEEVLGGALPAVVPRDLPGLPAHPVGIAGDGGVSRHPPLPAVLVLPADRGPPVAGPLVLEDEPVAQIPRHRAPINV